MAQMVHFKEWQWLCPNQKILFQRSAKFHFILTQLLREPTFSFSSKIQIHNFYFSENAENHFTSDQRNRKNRAKKNLEIISEKSLFRHTVSI